MKNINLLLKVLADDGIDMDDKGNYLTGNCPFHDEKNASFIIYKNTEKFTCFGCGEKGDAIDYIVKAKGLSYTEAVKYLNIEYKSTKVIKQRPSMVEELAREEQRGVDVQKKYGKLCDSLLAGELVRGANERVDD